MSDWRTRKETLQADHPNYDEFHSYFNRKNALIGKPLIPYGDPVDVPHHELHNPRTPPIGVGNCQRCGEIMLMRDESQKWCRSCRLLVKLEKMEAKYRNRRADNPLPENQSEPGDCEAGDCGEAE